MHLEVSFGTYTGWNLGRRDRFEDGFCSLQGSFVPFVRTKQDRLDMGDPRRTIEERYPSKKTYVAAIRTAANKLVSARLLLSEDAKRLVGEAKRGIRLVP